ncbi:MAG: hypothetical protein GY757_60865 [bacterium]|nr:hypothetical protein [bacterium]
MYENIIAYQGLAMCLPSTFYLSSGNEISSKGYGNFIKFYKRIQALKKQFVFFIAFKEYGGVSTDSKTPYLDPFFN